MSQLLSRPRYVARSWVAQPIPIASARHKKLLIYATLGPRSPRAPYRAIARTDHRRPGEVAQGAVYHRAARKYCPCWARFGKLETGD